MRKHVYGMVCSRRALVSAPGVYHKDLAIVYSLLVRTKHEQQRFVLSPSTSLCKMFGQAVSRTEQFAEPCSIGRVVFALGRTSRCGDTLGAQCAVMTHSFRDGLLRRQISLSLPRVPRLLECSCWMGAPCSSTMPASLQLIARALQRRPAPCKSSSQVVAPEGAWDRGRSFHCCVALRGRRRSDRI